MTHQQKHLCAEARSLTRRDALRLGALGLSLPSILSLRSMARANATSSRSGFGKAKSCIVLFAWGGMSHLDTWDMKPDAPVDIRGEFRPISTSVPGIQISEHMPHIARQAHRLAIVRSAHHNAAAHRAAAYWNLTGHHPPAVDRNWPASRNDWPGIGSLVGYAKSQDPNYQRIGTMPLTVSLPYTIADAGSANGQNGGFLGMDYDPIVARPPQGVLYDGKSPNTGTIELELAEGMDRQRLISRRSLLADLEANSPMPTSASEQKAAQVYRDQALEMLLDPAARSAFNPDTEPEHIHKAYGNHICGQSVLLARKLTEAGVPLVTVYCSAGDLNGSVGAHWDTHGDGFNRIKNQMMPPLDLAGAALIEDLAQRGRLDETLVVWLTEFGRTPKITHAGRDHYPNCYSVAFAGAGIAGGQVYGKSDAIGSMPADLPCGPADLHATIFHALGIDPNTTVHDLSNRPFPLTDGRPLPLFS